MAKYVKRGSSYSVSRIKGKNQIILINSENFETRIALIEKGVLNELIIERDSDRGIIGNIFKGRVERILPGIGAAFVDIGIGKNCFLYVSDIYYDVKEYDEWLGDNEDGAAENQTPSIENEEEDDSEEVKGDSKRSHYPVAIGDLIQEGQDIMVQIVKEPLGKKGARATTHITLPGRFLVLMPTIQHIGISRKIQEYKERDRLRDMAKKMVPEGMGIIVRTAAAGATPEEFRRDCLFLTTLWEKIQKKSESSRAPSLIHRDLSLSFRAVRDMLNENIDALVIDSDEEYERIADLVGNISPELKYRIHHHDISDPIFESYDIESQIEKLLQRKTWLKSGGHLYIDEAEALVAIDVNTGKFVGGADIEQTLVKTNIEAAKEIAHQIRSRGLGGLLVIDFIDMKNRGNRHKVYEALQNALHNDRERFTMLEMTEVGLIQMTRRRVRPSLLKTLTQSCPYCNGNGVILSSDTMSIKVLRELQKACRMTGKPRIMVRLHPELHKLMNQEMETELVELSEKYRKTISLYPDEKLHFEKFTLELLDI